MKRKVLSNAAFVEENSQEENLLLEVIEERISNWIKMVRVLAMIMKFCKKCRNVEIPSSDFMFSAGNIHDAEVQLVRMAQARDQVQGKRDRLPMEARSIY